MLQRDQIIHELSDTCDSTKVQWPTQLVGRWAREQKKVLVYMDVDLDVDLVVAPAFSQHHARVGGPIQLAESRCLA